MRRFVFLTMVALVMAVVLASPAWAATFTVDRIDDPDLSTTPTADDCTDAANDCSLRGAITAANANAGDDTIDIGVTGTVNLTAALPDLSTNIEIVGPGADQFTVTRPDTAENFRIFTVTGDTTVVTISGMTISNGNAVGDTSGSDFGGGIINQDDGTLTVTDSTISGNTADADGGGIENADDGNLTVTDSTISGNTAGSGTFGGEGGGIFSNHDSNLTVTDSTISGNTADGDGAIGGGVYNSFGLTVIDFSTITNNTAPEGLGSGVASSVDNFNSTNFTSTEVLSSIISANQGTDVDFVEGTTNSFVSRGYNLIGDGNATGAFNQTGDTTGVTDPGLDPLDSYGGPTQTHRLQSDSPAIDVILPGTNGCGTTFTEDQRGVSRPQGSACDIGSFELEESDTEAPRVISTFPRNGGEVGPAANITATFSEEMRPASVMNAFKLFRKGSTNQIDAAVTYDAELDIATLNPDNNLRRGVTYKAVVTTLAKDEAGNRLDQNDSRGGLQQKVWFFEIDN
jgi:hypothetical protein